MDHLLTCTDSRSVPQIASLDTIENSVRPEGGKKRESERKLLIVSSRLSLLAGYVCVSRDREEEEEEDDELKGGGKAIFRSITYFLEMLLLLTRVEG